MPKLSPTKVLVVSAIALVLGYLLRPLLHPLVMTFYTHPMPFILLIGTLVAMRYSMVRDRWEKLHTTKMTSLIGFLGVILFALQLFFGNALYYKALYAEASPHSEYINEAPKSEVFRWYPMGVASAKAKNRMQDSLLQLGDIDPVITAEGVSWQAPRIPNGMWNEFFRSGNGTFRLNADGSTAITTTNQVVGEGMGFSDSVWWMLNKDQYFAVYNDGYYIHEGEQLWFAAPFMTYRFAFPVMIPQWGGVKLINVATREVINLNPKEAQEHPLLKGQWLVPEALALDWVGSWALKNGVWNYKFTHRDQIEIPQLGGSDNQMPYLIPTDRLDWFVAAEPSGTSYSIFKLFWVDARTGMLRIMELPVESALIGPNVAQVDTRNALGNLDWDRTLKTTEPLPLFGEEGRMLWQVTVTDVDEGLINNTAIIDAETEAVWQCASQAQLTEFLANGRGCPLLKAGQVNRAGDTTQPASPAVEMPANGQFGSLSDQELLQLIEQAAAELRSRQLK